MATLAIRRTRKTNSPLSPIAIVLSLAVIAVVTLPAVRNLITTAHSFNHPESEDVRNCNNIIQLWLNKSCERLNIIKQLNDGRIGNQVYQPCRRGVIDVTAYIFVKVVSGARVPMTLAEAEAVLKAKGCTIIAGGGGLVE